jgi:hypothetical protein
MFSDWYDAWSVDEVVMRHPFQALRVEATVYLNTLWRIPIEL